MKLSIIIPAYNEEKLLQQYLPKTIAALNSAFNAETDWEIFVCDNNSNDKTAQIATSLGATVVFEPVNQIARARNCGAKSAQGEWLLFLDADSYLTPALAKQLTQSMQSPNITGAGVFMKVVDGPFCYRWLFVILINPIIYLLRIAAGACILVRKECFDEVGGFSSDLYILEEVELSKKIKKHAKKNKNTFKILTKNCCHTSGRKGDLYGFWSFMFFSLRLLLSPIAIAKRKNALPIWYDGKR